MIRTMAAAGLALVAGLGAVTALDSTAERANAQAELSVSAEQLRINQRIGQAGVRRSNEALRRLDQLIPTAGPIGPAGPAGPAGPQGPKGEPGESGPMALRFYAPVERPRLPGDPVLSAPFPGSVPVPVGLAQAVWPEVGVARVIFTGPIQRCALSATLSDAEGGEVSAALVGTGSPTPTQTVEVRTRASDGTPAPRRFDLLLFCPTTG